MHGVAYAPTPAWHAARSSTQAAGGQLERTSAVNPNTWKSEIHSGGNNARHVWRVVDNLLDEAKSGAKPSFSPEDYHSYIDKKSRSCQGCDVVCAIAAVHSR